MNDTLEERAKAAYTAKYGNPSAGVETFRMNNTVDLMSHFAASEVEAAFKAVIENLTYPRFHGTTQAAQQTAFQERYGRELGG